MGAEAAAGGAAASKSASQISLQEARQILGVEPNAPLEEVLKVGLAYSLRADEDGTMQLAQIRSDDWAKCQQRSTSCDSLACAQRYQHIFDANERAGSFYIQSKAHRAKERLEQELQETGKGSP